MGLREAGAPDFQLNLTGPQGVRVALAQPDSDFKAALLQVRGFRLEGLG